MSQVTEYLQDRNALTGDSDHNIHQVVSLIYQAASNPERWPDLLQGLAEFVDQTAVDPADAIHLPGHPANTGDRHDDYSLFQGLQQVQQIDDAPSAPPEQQPVSDLLTYHFRNALDIAQRLVQQEEHLEVVHDVIDRLPIGVIIVDKDRQVLQSNSNARRYIEEHGELVLRDDTLSMTDSELRAQLDRIVRKLAGRAPSPEYNNMEMLSIEDTSANRLLMFLMPARGGLATDGFSNTIIFLSHPKTLPIGIPGEVRQALDLTERESEVLSSLARGYTVKEIAEQDEVSEATIRTQLKSLFTKTGTSRQADLVKFALSIPSGSPHQVSSLVAQGAHKGILATSGGAVQMMELSDGRRLSYREYGRPNGEPMIYLHSVLGSHKEVKLIAHRACVERGIRLIAPNRPGFSHSDPLPDRTLLDYGQDLRELVDHLGIDTFYLGGQTMGGLYACAAAIELKRRIKKLLVVSSGDVPRTREEFAQQIPTYRFAQRLARDFPSGYRLLYNLIVKGMLKNQKKFFDNITEGLVPEEAALFKSNAFCREFLDGFREGYKQGGYHAALDVMLVMRDWGFTAEEIEVPVQLWHGTEDRHVPYILGKKFNNQLPDSELISVPGAGHFLAYRDFDQILERFLADT